MEPAQFSEMLVSAMFTQLMTAVSLFPQWAADQPILWLIPLAFVAGLVERTRPKRRRRR